MLINKVYIFELGALHYATLIRQPCIVGIVCFPDRII